MTKENSTTKPKLIILEGVDRTGKDTMWLEINKQTKYKHFVMDRGPIGFLAYCDIYNKDRSLARSYYKMEDQMAELKDVLVIYLTAETETLVDRCVKTDHEILDFDLHKESYEFYLTTSPLKSKKVDTTEKHVSEIVQDLIKEGIL